MKKLVFVVLLAITLSACTFPWQSAVGDVESLTATIQSDYYFEIIPDYQGRLLEVEFGGKENGTVGGDYFDRFEDIVDLIQQEYEDGRGVVAATDDQRISFSLRLTDHDEGLFVDFVPEEMKDYEDIESFHADIADLFEREIY